MMINNNGYLPNFEFNKTWEDPLDFPTLEANEEQVRADMQDLHEQVKEFINSRLIPAIRNGAFGSWELYDSEKQYETGDKVLYEGFIYVCKTPCQSVLPTDDTYWVKVNMGSGPGEGDTSWIYDEINKVYSELKQNADEISAEVTDLDDSLRAEITLTAEQLTSRIEAGEQATYSEIQQNAELIRTEIANLEDGIQSELQQTAQQIYTEVVDSVRGDLSRIEQEADEIRSTVADAQGDISSLKQTSGEISAGLADAEGDISQLKLTTDGLVSRVESNEGEISRVEQKADEISTEVTTLEGDLRSEIKQTADSISMSVSQATGTDGKVYATITLKVGDDTYTGQILMEGNLNVSGQLSADALYAAKGDIADLTVNRFSTSQRIKKYLDGDTTDDNYIIAQGEAMCFVSGVYAGGEVQSCTPEGVPLYWESYPYFNTEEGAAAGVVKGTDGFPFKDGVRIFTTTAETKWPVYTYTYNELIKRSIAFAKIDEHYVPVDIFGAGDEMGNQQGMLVKDTDGLHLSYVTQTGKELGVHMGDGGYTDVHGLRKTTGMNFAEWDQGHFYERIDGDETRYAYDVEFYADGKPAKITDSDGHEMLLYW